MKKISVWLSDLTHTAQGISAATFPLGVSFVYSYSKKMLGDEFDFELFKFPSHLAEALNNSPPTVLSFSNYSWNFELAYKFASLVKLRNPNVITVFGGPNFPTITDEMLQFLKKRSNIDFYIELEGELGFVNLLKKLAEYGFNANKLKKRSEALLNTSYIYENRLIHGPKERIKDINIIPSPYLSGTLDKFFDLPLVPMVETTRGCPFSCTFCSDGAVIKSKVSRYDPERVKEELHYVAKKVQKVDELIITDLNFGMYKQDVETAKVIRDLQQTYKYPTIMAASAGKNMPKRIIEVGKIVKGWILGSAVQSTDPEVLKSIKRNNISNNAYKELTDFGNTSKSNKTYTEVILGLPEDNKQKHFESLRFGIDSNVNRISMYQSMLLTGTEMSSQVHRKKFGLMTKFRTIPGCIGIYDIFGEKQPVAEIEEIIVGSNTLNTNDYLECRVMNLIIETFYNNAMFEEIYPMLRALKVSPMDCLIYIKEHPELYSKKIKEIIESFVSETTEDLFPTWEKAKEYVLDLDVINKYIGGELGTNELLFHRVLLFNEFDDICDLMFKSVEGTLKQKKLLTNAIKNYLLELKRFIFMRKKDFLTKTNSITKATFEHDFEAIKEAEYYVDPNSTTLLENPMQFDFFHDDKQQELISNQVKLYSAHAVGMGKMLQRTNMKLMFRNFVKSNQHKKYSEEIRKNP